MNVECKWKGRMKFEGCADKHSVLMDVKGPLGEDAGLTPKQMLLMSVCGCSAMDVVSLLKKYKQEVSTFDVEAEADATTGHPIVFSAIRLKYSLQGNVDPAKALEAVRLSQTQFCGVSAMVSRAVPISYVVEVNGVRTGDGKADFK